MKRLYCIFLLFNYAVADAQIINRTSLMSDIQTLSSAKYEGRETGSRGNKLAADFITDRFRETGLKPFGEQFRHVFTFMGRDMIRQSGTNIIGYIPGKKQDIIVVSAHYDHLGKRNEQIYYGADDNASGVAALIALAGYFSKNPPEHTLLFIAFDAEESGLKGSYAFLKAQINSRKLIKLNINLDMIAHNDKKELYAAGTYQNPVIRKIIEGADQNTGITLLFGHDRPEMGKDDWTMQSDHGPFAAEGIPFIYFGVEDHQDYHKPTDTFENINQDFFYNSSITILRCAIALDRKFN